MAKRFFISLLITAAIIIFLFTQISLRQLYELLLTIDPRWAMIGSISYLVGLFFRALRYKWLIHSRDVSFSQLFQITAIYNLAITLLPSKLGELSYPYFLNRVSEINLTEGLASLIVSRIYDFFIILVIFAASSVGFQDILKMSLLWITLMSAILICLLVLAFVHLSTLLRWFSKGLETLIERTGSGTRKPLHWLQKKAEQISEDFYAINARRTYLPVALGSGLSWIMIFGMCYAFLRGFGISVPFMKVVFGSTVAILASTIPISGLGNWGTLEAGWAAGFLLVGLSKEEAIASGFGVHILIFVTSAATGLFCWLTLKRRSPSPPA